MLIPPPDRMPSSGDGGYCAKCQAAWRPGPDFHRTCGWPPPPPAVQAWPNSDSPPRPHPAQRADLLARRPACASPHACLRVARLPVRCTQTGKQADRDMDGTIFSTVYAKCVPNIKNMPNSFPLNELGRIWEQRDFGKLSQNATQKPLRRTNPCGRNFITACL